MLREVFFMIYNTLHNRWLRIVACLFGQLLCALSLNLILLPLHLYSGGIMGVCQLISTFVQMAFGLDFGSRNVAGILYFIVNLPILLLAYRSIGREFFLKTVFGTAAYSFFCSVIPVASTPIVDDYLTCSLLCGILVGTGCGIILTCGGSSGGLDILGLYLNKKGFRFTIGKFSMGFNAVIYTICLIFFSPAIAIYSIIYNFTTCMMADRTYQQSINVQALIYTRDSEGKIERYVTDTLHRGVTYWDGVGAYTKEGVRVLSVCLTKFEIEQLLHAVESIDPTAFITVQEGVRVYGNFQRKIG